jgi:hypothetical protein
MLVEKCLGKGSLVCKDNIKMNRNETGREDVDWIHMAKDTIL